MTEDMLWLTGERAGIGPIRDDLMDQCWRWEQAIPTIVGYNRQTPQQPATTRDIYTTAYEGTSDRQIKFTVYDTTGDAPLPVGTSMLLIDPGLAVAEYTIALGEPGSRGRGVGSEATLLALDYAFHVTGLECVHLTVLEPNAAAIRSYERAGFRRQGVRRNSNKWLGKRVDEILMDAIPSDFPGPSRVTDLFGELNVLPCTPPAQESHQPPLAPESPKESGEHHDRRP